MKTWTLSILLLLLAVMPGLSRAADTASIEAFLSGWHSAQLSRQVDTYRAFYSPQFSCGDIDRKSWMADKRKQFENDGPLSLEISDVYINLESSPVEVTFISQSRGNQISELGEKKLILEKSDARWLIKSETWQVVSGFVDLARPDGPAKPPATGLRINSISYQIERDSLEKLLIEFNQFYTPAPFALEKDRPRVVFDFQKMENWQGPKIMPVNGRWIKRVRSHFYPGTGLLRIVLDLTPALDYSANPFYYQAENIYSLELTSAHP